MGKTTKRLLSFLTVLVMVIGMIPTNIVYATETEGTQDGTSIEGTNTDTSAQEDDPNAVVVADAATDAIFAGLTATLSFADKSARKEFSNSEQIWRNGDLVLTNAKASSTSGVGDYANPIRFYQNQTLEIAYSAPMSKIVFEVTTTNYANALKNSIGAEATVDGTVVTWTLSEAARTATISKLTAQIRMNRVGVMVAAAPEAPEEPAKEPDAEISNLTETVWQVTDSATREAFNVQLKKITFNSSLKVEVYHDDILLTTSTAKEKIIPTVDDGSGKEGFNRLTVNIVLWGEESSSWNTTVESANLTEDNIPNYIKVYCDGQLVDEDARAFDAEWIEAYKGLDIVKPAAPDQLEVATLADLQAALASDSTLPIVVTAFIDIPAGETVELDLNGKTVSANSMNVLRNNDGGTLTIKNGTVERTGDTIGYAVNNSNTASTLILENVTIKGGVYTSGKLTATNANISQRFASRHVIYASGCEVKLNSGNYHNYNAGNATIFVTDGATVTIDGGTFSIDNGKQTVGWTSNLIDVANGNCVINGGTIKGHFRVQGNGVLNINGGTFENTHGENHVLYTGYAVEVKGGTFTDVSFKTFATGHLADGYEVKENADGTYGVAAETPAVVVVASQGEAQEALDNAVAGTTIQLTADVNYGTLIFRANPGHNNTTLEEIADAWRYNYNRSIENITIIGANGAKVDGIIFATGAQSGDCNNRATVKNLVIDGVEFTDAFTASSAGYNAPVMITTSNATVDGLTIRNCTLVGDNSKLNLLYLYGADGAKNITLTDNTVDGIARLCELRGTQNVTITNNVIKNTYEHGILLAGSGYSGNVTITGNTAEGLNNRFVRMAGAGDAVVVISNNTITNHKGEDTDYIKVTDSTTGTVTIENNTMTPAAPAVTYVAQIDGTKYETLADAIAAAQAGDEIDMLADVVTGELTITKSITLNGNGYKLTPADSTKTYNSAIMVGDSGWGDDHGETITLVGLTFEGWKTNHGVIRAQGVTLAVDECEFNGNSVSNYAYAVLSLNFTDATVSSTKFVGNNDRAIDVNYNGDDSEAVVTIDGCTFERNTTTGAGIVMRSDGTMAVKNSTFKNNTVNTNGNGATVYVGFGAGNEVSGCTFENNTVITSHTTTKRFASAIFCDGCVVKNNIFGAGNTATRNGESISTIVAVGAYYGDADISGNYWNGAEPAKGGNYTVEYDKKNVTLNDYYSTCINGELGGKVSLVAPPIVVPENFDNFVDANGTKVEVSEEIQDVIEDIQNNTALNADDYKPVENHTDVEKLVVTLTGMKVADNVPTKITFNVEPKDANGNKVSTPAKSITFRLPIPEVVTVDYALVYHNDKLVGSYEIQGNDAARYVEITSANFSEFAVEPVNKKYVASVNGTKYESLQDAINAATEGATVTLLADIALDKMITVPAEKTLTIDGNNKKLTPSADFITNGHNAVIVLADGDRGYSENSKYTIKNLTFEGFDGLSRVVRANFCKAVIEACTFNNNSVSGGVITSADAKLTVTGCTFAGNTVEGDAAYGVIDLGSDVSEGTGFVADITNNTFTANTVDYAVLFLFSSANVTGNTFNGNTHAGSNPNAAAVTAGPYTGNMAYTINVNGNAFVNALSKGESALPAVYAEDWKSLGANTAFDLSANYWGGAEPVKGTDYATNTEDANLTLKSYYTSYNSETGALNNLVQLTLEGIGTEASPYLINTLDDLEWFRDDVNAGNDYNGKYVKLTADIDMSSVENWIPIGANGFAFRGYFDGADHTISNLKITDTSAGEDKLGLFGYIQGKAMNANQEPSVKNLKLTDANISSTDAASYIGALVANPYVCYIKNVHVTGTISGGKWTGGVIGNGYVLIEDASFEGTVTSNNQAGGIAGAGDARVYNSKVIGNITANYWAGGVIGNGQEGASAVGCYVKGTITANNNYYFGIGGIAGVSGHGYAGSKYENNYFDGEVYLEGAKVNSVVIGLVNAESNAAIKTEVTGNSWNTAYYPADTLVYVVGDVSENATPDEWAASAAKTDERNNNLVMLESDLAYVDAESITDVTKMSFSTVTDDEIAAAIAENNVVAQIGDDKYQSLQDAINAATEGATVTLLADVILDTAVEVEDLTYGGTQSVAVNIPADKKITLDLNGHKIETSVNMSGAYSGNRVHVISNFGDLTIVDSATTKGAIISNVSTDNTNQGGYTIFNQGTLLVDGATVIGNNGRSYALTTRGTAASTTVQNATVYGRGALAVEGGATVDVKSGLYYSNESARSTSHALYIADGNVTINGGTFKSKTVYNGFAVSMGNGKLTIKAGEFVGQHNGETLNNCIYLAGGSTGTVKIEGGNFNYGLEKAGTSTGNFVVSGGTFGQAIAEKYCAEGYIPVDNGNGTYGVKVGSYVAEVNGEKFETLAAAIEAAESGATVTLLADVSETSVLLINKSITINGNDHKITSGANRVFRITTGNVEVKFEKLNMVSTAFSNYTSDIRGVSIDAGITGVKLNLNNCSVKFDPVSGSDWAYAVNVSGETSSGHTVTINGGTYEGANVINVWGNNHTISIDGAVLNNLYNAPQNGFYGQCVRFEGTGCNTTVKNTTFNGVHAIPVGEKTPGRNSVAQDNNTDNTKCYIIKIGSTYYYTLAAAIEAAQNGDTIELLADVKQEATVTVPTGKDVTLELNGNVISGTCNASQSTLIYINNGAKLTVKDSSEEKSGKITYAKGTSNVGWTVDVKGDLVLESGTIELTGTSWNIGYAVDVRPNSWGTAYTQPTTFVMNGGNIVSSDGAVRVASSSDAAHKNVAASFTMNGGKIDAAWDGVFVQQSDAIYDDLSVTINGGTIESDLNPVRVYGPAPSSYVNDQDCMSIALNGGTLTYTGSETYEWIIEGVLRAGGGNSIDIINENGTLAVSADFAQKNVLDGYKWVENSEGTYSIVKCNYVAQVGEQKFESLQDAIEAAQDGDTITIFEGTHVLGDLTHIHFYNNGDKTPKNLTIQGEEGKTVVLDALYFNTNAFPENLTVKNITFDGTVSSVHGGIDSATPVNGLTVENCKFINGSNLSLTDELVKNVVVRNCEFANEDVKTSSIYIQKVENLTVSRCTISDGYNAIQLSSTVAGNIVIENNTISGVGDRAIRLAAVSGTVRVIGNILTDAADDDDEVLRATAVDGGSIVFSGNTYDGQPWEVENITSGNNVARKIAVAKIGETKYGTLKAAVDAAADGAIITLLSDVALSSTLVFNKAGTYTIDGNGHTITNNGATNAAIMLGDSGWNTNSTTHSYTLKNVVFDGWNTDHVVRVQGVDATIEGCTFKNCTSASVGIVTVNYSDATITGNVFKDNTCAKVIDAYTWSSVGAATITGNTITGNTVSDTAAIFYNGGEGCTITGNTITNNTISSGNTAVVYLRRGANTAVTGNVITGNTITAAAGAERAAVLVAASGATITGNAFADNTINAAEGTSSGVVVTKDSSSDSSAVNVSGNYWGGVAPGELIGSTDGVDWTATTYYAGYENGQLVELKNLGYVAQIGNKKYESLQDATNAVQDGETIELLAGTIDLKGGFLLPNTMTNVTIVGAADHASVIKNGTLLQNGSNFNFDGLTIDGVVFDDANIVITPWDGNSFVKDMTVKNCVFKNLDAEDTMAPIHVSNGCIENFTFTNNEVKNLTGGDKSGLYIRVTGDVVIENNNFDTIQFRPALIKILDCDGIADNISITNNVMANTTRLQVYGTEEGPDEGPWTPVGTDNLKLTIKENVFKNITGNYICTWGINGESDITKNYYDVDITSVSGKFYWNNEKPSGIADLVELGVYPYYADEAKTILVEAPVASITSGRVTYYYKTLQDAFDDAWAGDTIVLLRDVELAATATVVEEKNFTLDLNGHNISAGYQTGSTDKHLYAIENHGTLTLTDSKATGEINSRGIYNYGTLNVNAGVTINSIDANGGYAIDNYDGAYLVVNGATIATTYEDGDGPSEGYDATPINIRAGANAAIKDAKIINVSNYTYAIANSGTLVIDDAEVTAVFGCVSNLGGTATIRNGNYTVTGAIGGHAVYVEGGAVTIENGTYKGYDTNEVASYAVFAAGGTTEIKNGSFESGYINTVGAKDTSTIAISGGTYDKAPAEEYIVDGMYAAENADGTYTIREVSYVAQNMTTGEKYLSVNEAIKAAQDGDTIQVFAGTITEHINPWNQSEPHSDDKSITLLGANWQNDPNSATWDSENETVITGGMFIGHGDGCISNTTVTVKGFTFVDKGLTIAGQQNVVVENNKFEDITRSATSGTDASAVNVTGQSNSADSTVLVQNNYIDGTGDNGINLNQTVNATVVGNFVTNTKNNSITIHSKSYGNDAKEIKIQNNTLSNWGYNNDSGRAIRIGQGQNVTVTGNVMTNANAPEQYVKITIGNAPQDVSENYWDGVNPMTEGIYSTDSTTAKAEILVNYYTDGNKLNLVPITVEVADQSAYVDENGNGVKDEDEVLTSISAALTSAVSGQTVVVYASCTESVLMIPAGVTLDLNGKYVTSDNVFSFGAIVDNAATAGGIVISNDTTKAFVQLQPENAGFLPIYDTTYSAEVGCYRFYKYSLRNVAARDGNNSVIIGLTIDFTNLDAYLVLANSTNTGLTLDIDLTWVGMSLPHPVRFNVSTMKKFGAEAYSHYSAGKSGTPVMKMTVYGVDGIGEGTLFTIASTLTSTTRVSDSGNDLSYTVKLG